MDTNSFSLNTKSSSKTFSLAYSFSGITIKKILIAPKKTLPDNWTDLLTGVSLELTSTSSNGTVTTQTLYVSAYLTPRHKHSVFEINKFYPKTNDGNFTSLAPYSQTLQIALLSAGGFTEADFEIFYEATPGVS